MRINLNSKSILVFRTHIRARDILVASGQVRAAAGGRKALAAASTAGFSY
ncbi:MAG: hypothetical protein AAGL68_04735 [Pseudomonadota bacterium]